MLPAQQRNKELHKQVCIFLWRLIPGAMREWHNDLKKAKQQNKRTSIIEAEVNKWVGSV